MSDIMLRPKPSDYHPRDFINGKYEDALEKYIDYLEGKQSVFCGCIDKCSQKRTRFICFAKRKCIHKKDK